MPEQEATPAGFAGRHFGVGHFGGVGHVGGFAGHRFAGSGHHGFGGAAAGLAAGAIVGGALANGYGYGYGYGYPAYPYDYGYNYGQDYALADPGYAETEPAYPAGGASPIANRPISPTTRRAGPTSAMTACGIPVRKDFEP